MCTNEFYNGILYQIEYIPELSNRDYTKRHVYYIKTEDVNYPHAQKAINSIIASRYGYKEESIWPEALWNFKYKKEPSIFNALHKYFKFEFDELRGVYTYTLIEPYDD